MKQRALLALGLAVGLVLLLYMVTFQVRDHEAAILMTFGKAGDDAVKNADGHAAGLYWKLPWPIQEVRLLDTRVQVLEVTLEQFQTKDNQAIVLNEYVAWRVSRPLEFQRAQKNFMEAEKQLRSSLRNARALINRYTLDQLTNRKPEELKLAEAEQAIRASLQAESDTRRYGVEIVDVGIKRLGFTTDVSEKVFEQMRSTREMLAQRARSEGDTAAHDIRNKARSAKERILSFAQARAQQIRAEGETAAAQYNQVFKQNEDLAIFLRQIEALKETLKHNTTFVLDTKTAPFDQLTAPTPAAKP